MTAMTLKNLRRMAPPQDRECEALRLPKPLPYTRHDTAYAVPADERAADLGALLAWCEVRGFDGPAAVGRTLWKAVATEAAAGRPRIRAVDQALRVTLAFADARLNHAELDLPSTPADCRKLAEGARLVWSNCGQPGLAQACADTQHVLAKRAYYQARHERRASSHAGANA